MRLPAKWRRYVPFILAGVVLLCSFLMSSLGGSDSNKISGTFAQLILDKLRPIIVFLRESANWEIKNAVNFVLRKVAHMGIYFLLMAFITLGMRGLSVNKPLIVAFSYLIVLLGAVLDELHQIFVSGRSASPTDVMIDMIGASFFLLCLFAGRLLRIFLRWLRRDWASQ